MLALMADGLTVVRVLLAVAVVPVLGTGRTTIAAVLVGSAWLSDLFDGRAARASATPTRLGELDLWADTLVGAGAVLGFVAAGRLPLPMGVGVVVVLLAAFALTGNEAMSMLLQATGYGLVLWRTGRDSHAGVLVWLLAVITGIAIVNRRVFWERSLPTFFAGVAAVLRGRPSH
jgi:phosphatidylglycerophosphate synthase